MVHGDLRVFKLDPHLEGLSFRLINTISLTPDKRELAHRIIEEVFPKYGLKKVFHR